MKLLERVTPMLGALLTALLAAGASAQNPVCNGDFEGGKRDTLPAGWGSPGRGYVVELVDSGAHAGGHAVVLRRTTGGRPDFGSVSQVLDATPFQGKRVRLEGWVRTEIDSAAWVGLWLRVDRRAGQLGFFDNMQKRPIRSPEWRRYEIDGYVARDARQLNLGLLLAGPGKAWLDDVSLEVLDSTEGPRPLTARGLANEVAFARLLGYVRFFHPSDGVVATDWNAFAIRGMRAVESAPTADRLAVVLDSLFRPIAPSVVVRAGAIPATKVQAAPPTGALTVVAWSHTGVQLKANPDPREAYHSFRVRRPAAGGAESDSFPGPLTPFVADLGGGVRAAVPLAVFADSAGTLPRGEKPGAAAPPPPESFRGDDRATRLADVALAWNVFEHFYPYFDVVGTDWLAELPKALRSAATDSDDVAFAATLRRMVAALHDGHGNVRLATSFDRFAPRVLLGQADGKVVVLNADSSTHLRLGDVVLAVDGRPTAQLLAEREALISSATPQWARFRAIRDLLLGARATPVALEVAHPDGAREQLTLRRDTTEGAVRERRPAAVAELKPGIWYVDLERATRPAFDSVADRLAAARGLVLDMRGYPGPFGIQLLPHLSQTPLASAQWQIPHVTRPDHVAMAFRQSGWTLQPQPPYLPAPRVFLIDGRAISQAETLMGIVEAYRLGDIVGEPTAGTNGNINPFVLPGAYSVSWTGMKVLKHDGSRHHGVGIRPTVPVSRTVAGVAAGRDEQLERAIAILEAKRQP